MSAKVGHADTKDSSSDDEKKKEKKDKDGKDSNETKKAALKVGKKAAKESLKMAEKLIDSDLAEQAGCIEGIPGGAYICIVCKLIRGAMKAKKDYDKHKKKGKKDKDGEKDDDELAENIEEAANAVQDLTETAETD